MSDKTLTGIQVQIIDLIFTRNNGGIIGCKQLQWTRCFRNSRSDNLDVIQPIVLFRSSRSAFGD